MSAPTKLNIDCYVTLSFYFKMSQFEARFAEIARDYVPFTAKAGIQRHGDGRKLNPCVHESMAISSVNLNLKTVSTV